MLNTQTPTLKPQQQDQVADAPPEPTWRALLAAAGYLVIFTLPILLVVGVMIDWPILAFVVVFGLFPFARMLFGDAKPRPQGWPEWLGQLLHALPVLYLPAYLMAALAALTGLAELDAAGAETWVAYGLSLWIVSVLGLPPAHELSHRADAVGRSAARALSGAIGYPLLPFEHAMHHASRPRSDQPEWPGLDESAWAFALRRCAWVWRTSMQFDRAMRARRQAHGWLALSSPLLQAGLAWVVMLGLYGWIAGLAGALLFVVTSLGVMFAMALMTYVQHWGLAPGDVPTALHGMGDAWEDNCAFQSWLTLSIAFHESHHRRPGTPYFQLQATAGSPRQPAGYVALLLMCLVPPLWRRYMGAARDTWIAAPNDSISAGHRVWCFADHTKLARLRQSARTGQNADQATGATPR
jgi:Fatty acid desaturase